MLAYRVRSMFHPHQTEIRFVYPSIFIEKGNIDFSLLVFVHFHRCIAIAKRKREKEAGTFHFHPITIKFRDTFPFTISIMREFIKIHTQAHKISKFKIIQEGFFLVHCHTNKHTYTQRCLLWMKEKMQCVYYVRLLL